MSRNFCFDEAIKNLIKKKKEPCLYKKKSRNAIVCIILYVKWYIINGKRHPYASIGELWLSKNFFKKDIGEPNYILGIKIYRDRFWRLLILSQSHT